MSILEEKQEFPIKLKHPTHRPSIIEMILALTAQSLEWTDSRTKLSRSRSQSPRAGAGVGCESPEPRGTPGRDYPEIGSLANWEKCKRYFRQIDRKMQNGKCSGTDIHAHVEYIYFCILCRLARLSGASPSTQPIMLSKHQQNIVASFFSPEVNQYK